MRTVRRNLTIVAKKMEKKLEKVDRRIDALKMLKGVLILQLADLNKVLKAVEAPSETTVS